MVHFMEPKNQIICEFYSMVYTKVQMTLDIVANSCNLGNKRIDMAVDFRSKQTYLCFINIKYVSMDFVQGNRRVVQMTLAVVADSCDLGNRRMGMTVNFWRKQVIEHRKGTYFLILSSHYYFLELVLSLQCCKWKIGNYFISNSLLVIPRIFSFFSLKIIECLLHGRVDLSKEKMPNMGK